MAHAKLEDRFEKISDHAAFITGHPYHFLFAIFLLLSWAISGPFLHFSDTWQLMINTGTTVITWLLVILIQNSQNRNDAATHLKLDAIIESIESISNDIVGAEKLSTSKIREFEKKLEDKR